VNDASGAQQRDGAGRLRHLLTLAGVSREELSQLLDLAQFYVRLPGDVPARDQSLAARTVANLFFEPSTRTRVSRPSARLRSRSSDSRGLSSSTSRSSIDDVVRRAR